MITIIPIFAGFVVIYGPALPTDVLDALYTPRAGEFCYCTDASEVGQLLGGN